MAMEPALWCLEKGKIICISQLSSKGDDEVIRTPVFEGKSPFNKREQENPYIHMKGQETFRFAVTAMTHDLKNLIAQAGFSEGDIELGGAPIRPISGLSTRRKND